MRTLHQAALALEEGRITSRDLVEASLERIADPAGEGGRTFTKVYAQQARASADVMDALRRANRAPSRFAGIPISLKDLLDVAGEPTPAASIVLADAPPAAFHAGVVRRVLAAGLIPVGRTNMTEFAFSGVGINPHYGTPQSPYGRVPGDPAAGRVPGGSSSGAAVSVADGHALAAIGTDTGGSCRIPAAFCGVTGFKPTARRVPRDGVLPLSPTLDSVGPLAPSVACCAAMDAILAGEDAADLPHLPAAGLRLAVPSNFVLDDMDAATERSIDRAMQRLDRAGVVVSHLRFTTLDMIMQANARGGFAVVEAYAWHRKLLARDGARYDQRVAARMMPGAAMAAVDYVELMQARPGIIAMFASELAPFDALLMPTVPIAPPPIAAFAEDDAYRRLNSLILRNSAPINFLDGCAISLPCHDPGDAPAALTLAAPGMTDRRLLAVAHAVEQVLQDVSR
jgi:aspartyl-tRNA(Asn)/glutamyl-tRNA(Gln) amidotransferase subunit A